MGECGSQLCGITQCDELGLHRSASASSDEDDDQPDLGGDSVASVASEFQLEVVSDVYDPRLMALLGETFFRLKQKVEAAEPELVAQITNDHVGSIIQNFRRHLHASATSHFAVDTTDDRDESSASKKIRTV